MKNKGKEKTVPTTKEQTNIFEIPDSIIPPDKRAFIWDWNNKPPKPLTTITLNGTRLLTRGNTLLITAKQGVGKSSICEAICANHLNPNCDSLGFQVELPPNRNKIIYFDTEQSSDDTWSCGYRIMQRAGIKEGTVTKDKLLHIGLKLFAVKERKAYIETILRQNYDIGMVLIDGAADSIIDTNSLLEAVEFHDWTNTFNPAISIVTTVHTNPNDDKPRGHIGSEMLRKARAVLLLRKLSDGVREMTTDFAYGKNRGDNDQLTSYYKFSDEEQMFISAEFTPTKAITREKTDKYKEMLETVFKGKTVLSISYIVTQMATMEGITEPAMKAAIYRHVTNKLIQKRNDGWCLI